MTDKKLKKMLKDERFNALPSESIKQEIKRELFGAPSVSSVQNNQESHGAISQQNRKSKVSTSKAGKSGKRNLRFVFATVTSCVVVVAILFSVLFFLPIQDKPVSDTYLSIDINPSIEIVADSSDIVKEARALNADATLLLYGENLVGMTLEDAATRVVTLAVELGYIDASATDNEVSLLAINDSTTKEQSLQSALQMKLQQYFGSNNITCSLNMKSNNAKTNQAALLGVSLGKMELIKEVRAKQSNISSTAAKNMSVKELNELLQNYDEATLAQVQTQLENAGATALIQYRENLNAKQQHLEDIEDYADRISIKLNEIEKNEAELSELASLIDEFNSDFPSYAYTGANDNLEAIAIHFGDAVTNATNEVENALDNLSSHLFTFKNMWKGSHDEYNNNDNNSNGNSGNGNRP
ncbi:MAG: hypothetical protein PHE93_06115 [Clostridia bacterium]|nr:hypothetical protein [Clostridia bacterium]